jgi:hypothetical protein
MTRRAILRAAAAPALLAQGGLRFVRLERIHGIWWLITAQGKPMVSLGVNHAEPRLMLAPYNRQATLDRYGADFVNANGEFNPDGQGARKWVNQIIADLQDWGMSALGFHNGLPRPLFKDRLFFFQPVNSYWLTPYGRPAEYPDVFSEAVAGRIDRTAREVCQTYRDEPNLIGYVYNDRPLYNLGGGPQGKRLPVHPWVEVLRKLGPEAPGKQEWVNLLRRRHADAGSAASAHGFAAAKWDELLARTEWPDPETSLPDKDAFLPDIVERWYELHWKAIRRYDPNHLIFGDKLGGGFAPDGRQVDAHPNIPAYQYAVLAKYVDAILLEWYGRYDDQKQTFANIHRATGKPILLGDSSFAQLQPRQETTKGVRVDSQETVGKEYARYLEQALRDPFVLGWHYCGYIENWTVPGRQTQFQEQNGFKNPFEQVHEEAVSLVRMANRKAEQWHRGAEA